MRDTKAIINYIEQLDIYKYFKTYTQLQQEEMYNNSDEEDEEEGAGRPSLDEDEIENDATAASRDRGDNISDNRE